MRLHLHELWLLRPYSLSVVFLVSSFEGVDFRNYILYVLCCLHVADTLVGAYHVTRRCTVELYVKSLHSSRPDLCISKFSRIVDFDRVDKHLGHSVQECPDHHVQRESTSMSNFLCAQHFPISSNDNFCTMGQVLSKYSMSSLMDLSCQKRSSFISSAHGLKLPDTCMLMVLRCVLMGLFDVFFRRYFDVPTRYNSVPCVCFKVLKCAFVCPLH